MHAPLYLTLSGSKFLTTGNFGHSPKEYLWALTNVPPNNKTNTTENCSLILPPNLVLVSQTEPTYESPVQKWECYKRSAFTYDCTGSI